MKRIIYLFTLALLPLLCGAQGTQEQPTPLASAAVIDAQMGGAAGTEAHWYRIELPDDGCARFSTHADAELRLGRLRIYALVDGQAREVGNHDMDGYGEDHTITFSSDGLAAGAYLAELRHWEGVGSYRLTYEFIPCAAEADKEPNDKMQQAITLQGGVAKEGRLGYSYFEAQDRVDWYRIEVPEEGKLSIATHTDATLRLGWCKLFAMGGGLAEVASRDFDGYNQEDTTVVHTFEGLAPGEYYFQMNQYGSGYGGYSVKCEFTPCAIPADREPNNGWREASLISPGATQGGRLGYALGPSVDRKDFYRIELKQDGKVTFALHSEPTLRLYHMKIHAITYHPSLQEVASKDMDGYNKDTTVVLEHDGLAAGSYIVEVNHYEGAGGYTLQYECVENPFSRHNTANTLFDERTLLPLQKELVGTLGYTYCDDTRHQAWYSVETGAGAEVSVTITPDTTLSLSMADCYLYRLEGLDDDLEPILATVAQNRPERSPATLTYVREPGDNAEYVLCVNHYSGCGGFSVQNGTSAQGIPGDVALVVGGRNTVRKGVPGENPVTLVNTSFRRTEPFFLTFVGTEEYSILGFDIPGQGYVPIEDVAEGDTTAVFLIPYLDPGERYTITLISEGRGDIDYVKTRLAISTGIMVAVVGGIVMDAAKDVICDQILGAAADKIDLTPQEADAYAQAVGTTVEAMGMVKEKTGVGAVAGKAVTKSAITKCIEAVPGGKIVTSAGAILEATATLGGALRRRVSYWFQREVGLIPAPLGGGGLGVTNAKPVAGGIVASWDPNEMVGPAGHGDEHYLPATESITYRILFENKAEAGAPAWRVRISDQLDGRVFDLQSVRFLGTSHQGEEYVWETAVSPQGLVTWDIKGIELPPNVNAPEGEGWVEFSVDLLPGLPHGTRIENKATIIFDKNTPIETNVFCNTLDLRAPSSSLQILPYTAGDDCLKLVLDPQDEGSGVSHYALYVQKDGGELQYCTTVLADYAEFPLDITEEADYTLTVLAVDNVGNAQTAMSAPASVHTSTGITSPWAEGAGGQVDAIFSPSGARIAAPQRGVNVLRYSNGQARKVLVK